MTPAEIATAVRRAQSFAALPPADVSPLLGLAQLAAEALRTRDVFELTASDDPDRGATWDAAILAEAALREAIAPVFEGRLVEALSTVGAEHAPDPDWQRRVWDRIDAEPPRPSWWRRALRRIGGRR